MYAKPLDLKEPDFIVELLCCLMHRNPSSPEHRCMSKQGLLQQLLQQEPEPNRRQRHHQKEQMCKLVDSTTLVQDDFRASTSVVLPTFRLYAINDTLSHSPSRTCTSLQGVERWQEAICCKQAHSSAGWNSLRHMHMSTLWCTFRHDLFPLCWAHDVAEQWYICRQPHQTGRAARALFHPLREITAESQAHQNNRATNQENAQRKSHAALSMIACQRSGRSTSFGMQSGGEITNIQTHLVQLERCR